MIRPRDEIENDACYDNGDLTMEVLLDIRELLLNLENTITNAVDEVKR
jgi:hypothetical protein